MTTDEEVRAYQHQVEQKRIYDKRLAALRALLAPPGPRVALQAAWDPLRRVDPVLTPAAPIGPTPGVVDFFVGDGPPTTIPQGAGLEDRYLDRLTGDIYTLQETP